ncbi:hypothetical protein NGB36_07735 [Streptomyces sp. RB6PN25]|uniref:Integral membrane protein n=1 Tax=Streptomyces humicola TaxID=2953240 RepID=A0ABT1PS47_9ACTN|nr:hypothetical protein [Streptomyces humicola]MCQ4080494.1 hypothetical protein [Streptomyces humicola]
MGRGAYALARVAVMVRTAALWCWWLGAIAAFAGAFVPGFTGRTIGLVAGAALFLVAAATAFLVHRRRYTELENGATRAAKTVILQDRRVTARAWLRARRWWLLLALTLAVASSLAAPAAGGMLLAGLGAGLWAKAVAIGRWERRNEALLWVRPEWASRRGPAGRDVKSYLTTGPVAGDARPGGARRRAVSAAR